MDLRTEISKIAAEHPETRVHLVPLLEKTAITKSVDVSYAERTRDIEFALKTIAGNLRAHQAQFKAEFAKGKINWGYVGDLEGLLETLSDAAAKLK